MALYSSIYSDVSLHPSLSCFSTAIVLFAASTDDERIFRLFADSLSETVGIAPVFNNSLTFPSPKDPASLLYG